MFRKVRCRKCGEAYWRGSHHECAPDAPPRRQINYPWRDPTDLDATTGCLLYLIIEAVIDGLWLGCLGCLLPILLLLALLIPALARVAR